MTLTVGSLFSGIGGLDLGLERAGMTVVWQSEIDPYASRVLARHWPDVPNLGDVTTIDWSTVDRVDLICGGYPCQPFSSAGRREGEDDHRHLWPAFADAIRHLRPRYALLENVPGHLSLGFGRVLGDLAELGFDAEWRIVSAADVGAPHLRRRVFVVAHANGDRLREQPVSVAGRGDPSVVEPNGPDREVADAPGGIDPSKSEGTRSGEPFGAGSRTSRGTGERDPAPGTDIDGRGAPVMASDVADSNGQRQPQPGRHLPEGRGRIGDRGESLAGGPQSVDRGWWSAEPDVGRVAHGVPARMDRLRTLGNAVVPQVAEHVGRRILEGTW